MLLTKECERKAGAVLKRPYPNLSASPALSYLLGVRYGDMGLYKRDSYGQYGATLNVKDRDFAEGYRKYLKQVIDRPCRITEPKEGYFSVGVNSRHLYNFFKLPLAVHTRYIEYQPALFIRGFFDSEGNVPLVAHCTLVSATNTNLELLKYVRFLLRDSFNINSTIYAFDSYRKRIGKMRLNSEGRLVVTRKMVYTLCINKIEDGRLFLDNIGFTIERKLGALRERLAIYDKVCRFCGKPFPAHRTNQNCCSSKCNEKLYYQTHKDAIIRRVTEYRDSHPDECREYSRRHREKMKLKVL